MANHLSKRNGVYYFRRKIPSDLVGHFGRKQIMFSLGTHIRAEALPLAAVHTVMTNSKFAAARSSKPSATAPSSVVEEQKVMTAQEFEKWDRARVEAEEEAHELFYQTEEQEHAEHDRFEALVAEESYRQLAKQEALRRMGDAPAVTVSALTVATPTTAAKPATVRRTETLRDVVPSWEARTAAKDNAKSRTNKALALFEEAVGKIPLRDLKKAHGANFVRFLLAEARGFSRKTAHNHASCIRALLEVAVKDDLIDRNPLDLSFDKSIGAGEREPWSPEELTRMYSHALFSDQMDTVRRWDNVAPADGRAVLLMLQHTGARIGEIAQLRRGDFLTRDGITAIRITAEAGTVKTKESERTIPLANHLLADPWFASWLTDILDGTRPNALALPSMHGRAGGPADTAVKWFRAFRDDAGLPPGKLKGAHRFRHWIRSELAARDVGEPTADAITGHAAQGSAGRVVYTTISLPVMLAALNRLNYPKISAA